MDNYLSLHQHLLGLATSDAPWKYTQVEIDHHVEEMEVIRNTCDSRLQCLCALYCYLRDGQANNWHSNSLQYKRNMEVFSKVSDVGSEVSIEDSPSSGYNMHVCKKCKTCLHTGGHLNCPWGHLGDEKAKKEAAKALRGLSSGLCNYGETKKPAGRRAKTGGRKAAKIEGDLDAPAPAGDT
jgi:hypothetical protein